MYCLQSHFGISFVIHLNSNAPRFLFRIVQSPASDTKRLFFSKYWNLRHASTNTFNGSWSIAVHSQVKPVISPPRLLRKQMNEKLLNNNSWLYASRNLLVFFSLCLSFSFTLVTFLLLTMSNAYALWYNHTFLPFIYKICPEMISPFNIKEINPSVTVFWFFFRFFSLSL